MEYTSEIAWQDLVNLGKSWHSFLYFKEFLAFIFNTLL